jgi:CDP-diacylglycerol--glycerol-3-phosphate 3-phosphatidyltransferase
MPLLANFLTHRQGLLACAVLAVAGVTDILDGYIARVRKEESSFGKLMDPVADKILLCVAILFLAAAPNTELSPWLGTLLLAREFLITGLRSFVASEGLVMGAGNMGKTKTLLQFLGLGGIMLGLDIYPGFFLIAGHVLLWAAVVLSYWSMVRYSTKAYLELKAKIR